MTPEEENRKLREMSAIEGKIYVDHLRKIDRLEKELATANLQVREQQDIVEAAVELVKWHGAGALKGERYSRLFSLAGNFLLGRTEKRVCQKCGNIGYKKPHDEATCDGGNG